MGAFGAIPLSVATPGNPQLLAGQVQGQQLGLKQLAGQIATNQQVQQENTLKLQKMTQLQQDQETFRQALRDNTTYDPDGTPHQDYNKAFAQAAPQMDIGNAEAFQTLHNQNIASAMAMTNEQKAQMQLNASMIGRAAIALRNITDPTLRAKTYPGIRQNMLAQGINPKLLPETPDANFLTNDSLDSILDATNLTNTYLEEGDKKLKFQQAQRQADIANAAQELRSLPNDATGSLDPAAVQAINTKYHNIIPDTTPQGIQQFIQSGLSLEKVPEVKLKGAEAGLKEAELAAVQDPQSYKNTIEQSIRDPLLKATYGPLIAAARTYPDKQRLLSEVAAKQAQQDLELNPSLQAMRIQTSAAEGAARADTQGKQQAKKDYIDSYGVASQAQAQADTIRSLVQKTQAGDKVAAASLKSQLGILSSTADGIKRINNGQLTQDVGSAGDKIQAWLNKLGTGVDFTPEILNQIPGVADTFANTAVQVHNAKTQAVNGTYGSNLPLIASRAPVMSTAPKVVVGQKIPLKNGKTVTITVVHPDGTFDAN